MSNLIITIGREFGSAGKDVGIKLGERLNIPCFDKELLERAAQDSEFCKEIFEQNDEKPSNSFLYSFVSDSHALNGFTSPGVVDMPLKQKVFLAQFEAIKKIAQMESCVMIGRCADYALADHDNLVRVFVRASEEYKMNYIRERFFTKTDKETISLMEKINKKRSNYYNYYTGKRWGDSRSYDLCLSSSDLGIDGCVDLILEYIRLKEKFKG
ncbi:MAG: cytidylate kinase-like family protein [Lachnospiraceae bacterium]|nr:cytidylate kinase-like family protein [Lachnospiraceae bacterium]